MALVVFLKGVNVGRNRAFRPSAFAKSLARYRVTNIGAAGTFVVAKPIRRARLREELRDGLPFEAEAMICEGKDVLGLAGADAFAGEPSGPDIVHFAGVMAKGPRVLPVLPLHLPPGDDWLVRIIAIRGRFAFGQYRRTMRTIGMFDKLEKHLGTSLAIRNWNTITKLIGVLRRGAGR